MHIKVYRIEGIHMPDVWDFAIVTKNGVTIASAHRTYASRRNAVAAAKLIAGSRLKVVVKE